MGKSRMPDGFGPNDPTASDRARTDHTTVTFTLKEGPRGEPWIAIEEDAPGVPVLRAGDAFLGLHFREGITLKEAQALTAKMREVLDRLSYTKFMT